MLFPLLTGAAPRVSDAGALVGIKLGKSEISSFI